jgi:DNA-binding transcriptional LysR family regulator
MKLWQELDKLQVFVTVAEKGKINQASDALGLTQPSITRSIQKLEQAFGVPLFARSRDGVKLTLAGTLLFERSMRFLRELEDIQARAQHSLYELAGSLTVGTYESLAEYLWPDFLVFLQKEHPHLLLTVTANRQRDPVQDLLAGRIDMLVDAEPQIHSAVASWPIYSDKFNFYVSAIHAEEDFTPAWASEHALLYVQGAFDEDRFTIEDHVEKSAYRFARQCRFDSFSTAKRLAAKGMGVAILPMRLAEEDEHNRLIKRVQLKGFSASGFGKHTIYATVERGNEREPRAKKIISLLKDHLR